MGIDESDHLMDHLECHVGNESILFDLTFFQGIAPCELREKHAVIGEVLIEEVGCIHAAPVSRHQNQSPHFARLL